MSQTSVLHLLDPSKHVLASAQPISSAPPPQSYLNVSSGRSFFAQAKNAATHTRFLPGIRQRSPRVTPSAKEPALLMAVFLAVVSGRIKLGHVPETPQ